MKTMHNILVIGTDKQALNKIFETFRRHGYLPKIATSAMEGLKLHREQGADVVLVMLPLKDNSGEEVLVRLKAQNPRGIIVVCGKDEKIDGASRALELGAFEYLQDPLRDVNELLSVVSIALGARRSDAQLRYLRRKDAEGADWQTILGRCPAMRRVFYIVRQICERTMSGDAPMVLLTGETGTGKGLLAKAIHYNSIRRSRAFVEINCAALPPALVEAELFGHTRGAFTDARFSRMGLFETADGGTLFLDEIGALPLELQSKALTAIEEKIIRRLGSSIEMRIEIQVIAATNRDLTEMVESGQLRADLYHRLNVLTVELPPLRERGEDKIGLAEEFVRATCREYGMPEKQFSEAARKTIMEYVWPGNVRELKNLIKRTVLLEDGVIIEPRHFHLKSILSNVKVSNDDGDITVSLPESGCPLDTVEREIIRQSLDRHQGNVSKTARYLGISRRTLIYRLKKHGFN